MDAGAPQETVVYGVACDLDGGVDAAGNVCSDAGACVQCNTSADCKTGFCELGVCVNSTCDDHVQDDGETDVDCGGPCSGCATGQNCKVDKDCANLICDPSSHTCTMATCYDGVQNEQETGGDCGGPICGAEGKGCPAGDTCVLPRERPAAAPPSSAASARPLSRARRRSPQSHR